MAYQASFPAGAVPAGNVSPSPPCSGKLKIFFGYAAGVGKTYAMLEAALRARDAGIDVVCGCIDPDVPPATQALLKGLEQLPLKVSSHKGAAAEFDLDAAFTRRPQLILVDAMAHTNGPGCRHINRYQDVQELLRAGIDVYSTLNVQDLESLGDVIEAITGQPVTSHVPDSIFDQAHQVEVVDLEPADLLERLRPAQKAGTGPSPASPALTEKALAALREITLRRTADRLERIPGGSPGERKIKEHIMICLSGAPSNPKVIRTAARLADAFHGSFTALFVEPPDFQRQDESYRLRVQANLRLAEELGARVITAYGNEPAIQIAEYAKVSGITKIVLGRSPRSRSPFPAKPLVDQLNTLAPDLDIYIIPDQPVPRPFSLPRPADFSVRSFSRSDTFRMLAILGLCSAVGFLFLRLGFNSANIIMVYILGVLAIAMMTNGRRYSLLSSVLSVLIFNFFFTFPYFSLMSDPSYLATFAVMFLVAILGSSLTTRVQQQAAQNAEKAYRTEILLETSQKLQKAEDAQSIIAVTATQLSRLLERDLVMYPLGEDDTLLEGVVFPATSGRPGDGPSSYLTPEERAAAEWVWKNNKHAGITTSTFPEARCLYMAIRGSEQVEAVAGIAISPDRKPDAFEKNLMIAILDECGLALEKERVVQAKRKAEEAARQEALRANLLRAISHDLRTPLTSISGNAGILLDKGNLLSEAKKDQLYASICDDALWLINLVENLLSITRMEEGSLTLHMQPELLEDVFSEALAHLDRNAKQRSISVDLPDDLLMADMDARLIVQVLINMVNNAIKYTPPGSHIILSARKSGKQVLVAVSDDGPGIPEESREKLFDMFYTLHNKRGDGRRGLGLGLSLCRSIITAHGGAITVENCSPHGARFSFTLQLSEVNTYE